MNKAFEDWCNQEDKEEYSDEEIFDMIREEIFPLLSYDQRHIYQDNIDVSFNKSTNVLIFDKAKSFDLDRTNGQCIELAERTLKLIKIRFPEFAERFEVVLGQEPNYFSQYMSQHYFLAEKSDYIDDPRRIIIDPSFQKIGPSDFLGYFINGKGGKDQDLKLLEGQLTPYSFLENDLLFFGWLRKYPFADGEILLATQAINKQINRINLLELQSICIRKRIEEIFNEIFTIREKMTDLLWIESQN